MNQVHLWLPIEQDILSDLLWMPTLSAMSDILDLTLPTFLVYWHHCLLKSWSLAVLMVSVLQNGRQTWAWVEFIILCCLNFGCANVIPVFGNFKWQPVVNLWPNLLITVNFTTLRINATSLSNYGSRTVLIVVGMHGDMADIVHNTVPIPLVPNAHLLGGILLNVQYQYRNLKLASLGVFSSIHPLVHIFSPTSSL